MFSSHWRHRHYNFTKDEKIIQLRLPCSYSNHSAIGCIYLQAVAGQLLKFTQNHVFLWICIWLGTCDTVTAVVRFWHSVHITSIMGSTLVEAQWPIGYGVGLRIKRSSVQIRPWPLRWVLGQGPSLLPLSQGETFTLASISYLAILVKYILAKKNKTKKKHTHCETTNFRIRLVS